MKPEEIAFKDFQSAVSVQEFEAVLGLCRNQYEKASKIVNRREIFLKETEEKFNLAKDAMSNDEVHRGINKLVKALIAKADNELYKHAYDDLKDLDAITEFLRRFGNQDDYPELDITFLKKIKKEKDGTIQ